MSSFVNLLSSPARTSFKELFLGGPILGSVSASAFRDLFLGFTVAREISPLQEKTQELAKKMGVTIPVRAVEQSRFSWAAHGCVFFGLAHISVPSDLVDSDLHTAILAHEIAHIKHNDCFWMFVITTITSIAACSIAPYLFPTSVFFQQIFCFLSFLFAVHVKSVRQEKFADAEAMRYLNNDQKLAIGEFFEVSREANLRNRAAEGKPKWVKFLKRCWIDANGDSLRGKFSHPSLISRIEKFREALI